MYGTLVAVSHNGSVSLVHYITVTIHIAVAIGYRSSGVVSILCEVSNLQVHLLAYVFCFTDDAVLCLVVQVAITTPKDIAKVGIGKGSIHNESCLSKHIEEEELYFAPPTLIFGTVKVRVFCHACKILLGCNLEVPVVLGGKSVDCFSYLLAGVVIDILQEGVEVLTKQLTESVVCYTLMQDGAHNVLSACMVRKDDYYLASLRVIPTFGSGTSASKSLGVGLHLHIQAKFSCHIIYAVNSSACLTLNESGFCSLCLCWLTISTTWFLGLGKHVAPRTNLYAVAVTCKGGDITIILGTESIQKSVLVGKDSVQSFYRITSISPVQFNRKYLSVFKGGLLSLKLVLLLLLIETLVVTCVLLVLFDCFQKVLVGEVEVSTNITRH